MKKEVKSLDNIYDAKNNSFTILSIMLSLLIIIFHCYTLFYGTTTTKHDLLSGIFRGENTGSLVVASFCIISGFMITTSIQKSKNIGQYLIKRLKRIFPAYILVLLLSTFVLAPLVSSFSFKAFYSTPSLYINYLIDNVLLFKNTAYSIADVFINNPYPSAINGSIWYIKHQFFCYLYIIPLFLLFMKSNKNKKRIEFKYYFAIILIITILSYSGSFIGIYRLLKKKFSFIGIINEIESLIKIVYYFSVGCFINIYKDKIMYDKKNILFALLVLLITFKTRLFPYFCLVLLPYFVIFIGSLKSKIKLIDISYYIFLVAFPVQQTLTYYLGNKISFYQYFGLSLSISILCSCLIYLIIDKIPKIIKEVKA